MSSRRGSFVPVRGLEKDAVIAGVIFGVILVVSYVLAARAQPFSEDEGVEPREGNTLYLTPSDANTPYENGYYLVQQGNILVLQGGDV